MNRPLPQIRIPPQEAADIFGDVDDLMKVWEESRAANRSADPMAGIEEELQLGECGAKCEWWCGQRYDDASGWAHGSAPYPWTKHHAEPGAEGGEEGLG